ncbi:hypothetical protein [Rhizobium sp. BR 314]|uniref:hypothetical protein n=1 Tax=Rhizobium sp. BR 314 TaxID=3040013 RepID=UPI0039BFB9E9
MFIFSPIDVPDLNPPKIISGFANPAVPYYQEPNRSPQQPRVIMVMREIYFSTGGSIPLHKNFLDAKIRHISPNISKYLRQMRNGYIYSNILVVHI